MYYQVNIRREDWTDHVVVKAKDVPEAIDRIKEHYPDYKIVSVQDAYLLDVII